MRVQSSKACEEQARAMRLLRRDLIQVNAEKADMAAERVAMIKEIDDLRRRLGAAERALNNARSEIRIAHQKNRALAKTPAVVDK